MGWMSGKKPVFKLNVLRLGHNVQDEFLRDHLKLNKRQVGELKEKLQGKILRPGQTITASQFQKKLSQHDPDVTSKWQEYLHIKEKEYAQYQAEIKQANIKKVRQLDRKKEEADKMVAKLTGRESPEKWRDKFKQSITAERVDLKALNLTNAEKRVMSIKEKIINPKKTEWKHAETGRATTVHQARQQAQAKKQADLQKDEQEIEAAKEQAKNLPELQI
jgi:hypothetical protein